MSGWFSNQRQDWIDEMLSIYGFINREHIMKKFDVSMPQASQDIQLFMRMWPGRMAYNKSSKRYERIEG
jgi:phenylalanyl-tRNA synthetase beta subunit